MIQNISSGRKNVGKTTYITGEKESQTIYNILCVEQQHEYFSLFSRIPSIPKKLFYKGDISLLSSSMRVAIVGPRKMSVYAQKILQQLFCDLKKWKLAGKDIVIISGGAQGVDEYAHILAIEYGFKTICVLGGGISYYKNSSKHVLVDKIVCAGGLLLTEYDDKFTPTGYSFPQRNRIIAGLSQMVFLPEAGEKSGSLLTVGYANKIGIPVYAPMQDIFNIHSLGSNRGIITGNIKPIVDFKQMLTTCFGSIDGLFEMCIDISSQREQEGYFVTSNLPIHSENSQNTDRESTSVQDFLVDEMKKRLGI